LKETERVFCLMLKRGNDIQHFGAFRNAPTYEQARTMAMEVLEGTRLPRPLNEQPVERQAVVPARPAELQRK
jgi:hypothetical protein